MEEAIAIENIEVDVKAENWEQSIKSAGELLLRSGYITEAYIDEMIKSVQTLGPYMVLMPGFALAHAAPSKAVVRDGMSLITLGTPVKFGCDNDPVSVVLCLACINKTSHMEKLQIVANTLLKDNIVEHMRDCRSAEELSSLFNE
ncbi:MAG: PTS sugar transporter subunit IIA [Erysipelotrichia bacterium]|nr:PTS sugar transporter subunit IIA [Erysipelotrichia bacterium]